MPFVKAMVFGVFKTIKQRWKLLTLIILVLIGGGYFFYSKQQALQPKLKFTKPQVQDIVKTLEISGVVDAKEKASLRFAAGGKVVYLGAKEGDQLKKGQTIATIDRRTLEKQLQQDLNDFQKQRLDWDQVNQDTSTNFEFTPTENRTLQKEQLDLSSQVLNVEIQDIAIKNTVLAAPFAGVLVSSPTAVTGVNLLATDVFEVVNPTTLIFRAAVDEADIPQVKVGQSVKITLDSYRDQPIDGTVSFISYKSQQSASGTVFVVEIPLAREDLLNRYRLGMNGDAEIILATKPAVMTIPLDATRERDGKVFVDVKTGENTAAERQIEVGLETDDLVEVTSGLSIDEEIVLPE